MTEIYEVTAGSGLRMRSWPETGDVLTVMPHGAEVRKLGEWSNDPVWWRVIGQVGGLSEEGYVHSRYLAPHAPEPASLFRIPFFSSIKASMERLGRFVGDIEEVSRRLDGDLLTELNAVLTEYKINTKPKRFTHFMAQIAHESGHFNFMEENLNYSAEALHRVFRKYFPDMASAEGAARQPEKIANIVYASRMGNGPTETGDGYRYRGRGFIQLTGKENYQAAGDRLGLDLVGDPDQVAGSLRTALLVSADYWKSRNLNKWADRDDVETITRLINGGYNGLADRKRLLARARSIWGG